eukprot:11440347-Prorocentrum_lima.AAC.1
MCGISPTPGATEQKPNTTGTGNHSNHKSVRMQGGRGPWHLPLPWDSGVRGKLHPRPFDSS